MLECRHATDVFRLIQDYKRGDEPVVVIRGLQEVRRGLTQLTVDEHVDGGEMVVVGGGGRVEKVERL